MTQHDIKMTAQKHNHIKQRNDNRGKYYPRITTSIFSPRMHKPECRGQQQPAQSRQRRFESHRGRKIIPPSDNPDLPAKKRSAIERCAVSIKKSEQPRLRQEMMLVRPIHRANDQARLPVFCHPFVELRVGGINGSGILLEEYFSNARVVIGAMEIELFSGIDCRTKAKSI